MYKNGKIGNYKNINIIRGLKMTFIGMVSDYKSFENVKEVLKKNKNNDFNLIHICKKSISNIKNIKFEIIVIDGNLCEFKEEMLLIEKICANAKFVVINSDINMKIPEFIKNEKIITYGLNQRATVTISSITESSILIYQKYANMKFKYRNRQFWCRGYYVDTVGKNTERIKEYIANQLKEDEINEQISITEYVDPFKK